MAFDIRSWPEYNPAEVPPIPEHFQKKLNAINPNWEFLWMPRSRFYGVFRKVAENTYSDICVKPICKEDENTNLVYRPVDNTDMKLLEFAARMMRDDKFDVLDAEDAARLSRKEEKALSAAEERKMGRAVKCAHRLEKMGLGHFCIHHNRVFMHNVGRGK